MKSNFGPSLFVVLIMSVVLNAQSATYYVDFADGNDSNSGLSEQTPFKRCPGDSGATGTASSTVLSAGDIVVFKGGVSYLGTVNLNRSGTGVARIVYDGNSGGTFGTGRALFNFTNHPTINIGFRSTALVSNLTIRNFIFTEIGGYDVLPQPNGCSAPNVVGKPGDGIQLYTYSAQDVMIQNCSFDQMGEWQPVDPFSDSAINGNGITLQNCHRITISGCEFTKMHTAISIKTDKSSGIGTSDIIVTNCNIHNYVGWGVDVAGRASGCTLSNVWILKSDFHDYQEYDLGQWAGCGERIHTDGVFIRNVYSGQTWAGWNRIDGCRFFNTNAVGGGSACISITEGPSFDIINNLFMNTVHGRTIYLHNGAHPGDAPQTNNIWNNTFWNDHTAVSLTRGGFDLGWVSILNNIFYDTRPRSGSSFVINSEEAFPSCLPDELDFNLYFTSNSQGSLWKNLSIGDGELNLTEIKALGYEVHGILGDPLFVDISKGYSPDVLLNNLRLRAGSPAIRAGKNLSRFFGWDYLHQDRQGTGFWTIGAYDYSDGLPEPPPNLRKIAP